MAQDVLDLADRLWRGETTVDADRPWPGHADLVDVGTGTAFFHGFSNAAALVAGDELVLLDTADPVLARTLHERVRGWTAAPLTAAVYSHGHIDHVFGVGPFEAETGRPAPVVYAHEALPARFDRYVLTAGYNTIVNQRQFQNPDIRWPTVYRYPDRTYRADLTLEVGGEVLELHHARGETDDHTWTWVPGRKLLYSGDLFIWASPNAGNPQKVQRYPAEWAAALRRMAGLGADLMLPGHGVPVVGADRVRQALTDTAEFLQGLHDQTVVLMNAGATLDEIVHTVRPPAALADRPYLQPVYDEPEFVVRTVWRQYGGWYDGNPARLKPAPDAALAAELAALAGGAAMLARRAEELLAVGDDAALRLAGHLAQLAVEAEPASAELHAVRARSSAAGSRWNDRRWPPASSPGRPASRPS